VPLTAPYKLSNLHAAGRSLEGELADVVQAPFIASTNGKKKANEIADNNNKSIEGDSENFLSNSNLTNNETAESLVTTSACSTNISADTSSSLSEPSNIRKKARNGMANRDTWFRNTNKSQRLRSEAYCSSLKNEQGEFPECAPRLMGPRCDSKRCQRVRSCHLLSDEDHQRIFSSFWSMMDWDQRKIYVVGLADMVDMKRKKDSKRRQHSVKQGLF